MILIQYEVLYQIQRKSNLYINLIIIKYHEKIIFKKGEEKDLIKKENSNDKTIYFNDKVSLKTMGNIFEVCYMKNRNHMIYTKLIVMGSARNSNEKYNADKANLKRLYKH